MKKQKKKKKNFSNIISFITIVFIFFSFALYVQASSRLLEVNYPELFGQKLSQNPTLPEYVKYIYNISFIIVVAIALGTAIYGGIIYMLSSGNPGLIKKARNQIFGGVTGIIILFSSYIVLYTINPSILIFSLPPLKGINFQNISFPKPMSVKNPTLIQEELPVGKAITDGLWEKERIKKIKENISALKSFLQKKIAVKDKELENPIFESIASLNKYLKTVTDECRCENLLSLCTKPETGAFPIGCLGDPCQSHDWNKKNGSSLLVEPNSPREKMNVVLQINREKIRSLLAFQKEIKAREKELREELRKYQTIEGEMISCQEQGNSILTLNEELSLYDEAKDSNGKVVDIKNYYNNPGKNNLTFYCSEGGTIYDYPYVPEREEPSEEELKNNDNYGDNATSSEKLSCPVVIPVGQTLGKLKDMAISTIFQLKRISSLIDNMTDELQEMAELTSKCNEKSCNDTCACVPNPCYHKCWTILCGPFCHSRCLQSVGGCHGAACPVKKIEEKEKEIKITNDSLLDAISQINKTFPKVKFALDGEKNPENLKRLNILTGLCYSPDKNNPSFGLLTCQQAKGNYGPNGMIISNCVPSDFYCCSMSKSTNMPSSISTGNSSKIFVIPPLKAYQPLPEENNCPEGWRCRFDVSYYNQYNDASQPLKELISCMREKLDNFQKARDIKKTIGIISSISDSKLYKGTCNWETGPTEEGGCSHIYEVERGKERISSHYGGVHCNYEHKSYAMDISLASDFQRKYANEIIKAAKTCQPGVYILNESSHLHIDIARIYGCK